MYVFLILVFGVNGGTINFTYPMLNMETCERALKLQTEYIPRNPTWTTSGASKPLLAECKEIK